MSKKESQKKETPNKKVVKEKEEVDSSPSDQKKSLKRKSPKEGIEVKDDGVYFDLNAKKKICVKRFKANILIDLREYFMSNGELLPTKKGIALTVESWKKLKEYIEDIDEAIENA